MKTSFGASIGIVPPAIASVGVLNLIENPDISAYVWASGEISLQPADTGLSDVDGDFSGEQIHGVPLPREFPIGEFMHQSSVAAMISGLTVPLCLVGLLPIDRSAVDAVGDNAIGSIRITIPLGVIRHLMITSTVNWQTEEGEAFCPNAAHDVIAIFTVPRTERRVRTANNGDYAAFVEPHRLRDRLFVFHFSGPEHGKCVYRFDEWVTRVQPERRRQVEMTFLIQSPSPRIQRGFFQRAALDWKGLGAPPMNVVPIAQS